MTPDDRPLGFTGTQYGTTSAQYKALRGLFELLQPTSFRQGCCVGADDDATVCFAGWVTDFLLRGGWPKPLIVGYPSNVPSMTARRAVKWCDELRPEKPPLERNPDIVNDSRKLAACPKGFAEELRSGTWSIVRYARKLKRHIYVIWPDGTITEENAPTVATPVGSS